MRVRVLVAGGNVGTQAARQATSSVPIVSVNGLGDPVGQGAVASLARPGGNLTGISPSRIYFKGTEMLAEIVPAGRRLAYMGNESGTASPRGEVAEVAAQRGLELRVLDVRTQSEPGTWRASWRVRRPAISRSSCPPT
jgi:putative ABC transport system substrate-binding protein